MLLVKKIFKQFLNSYWVPPCGFVIKGPFYSRLHKKNQMEKLGPVFSDKRENELWLCSKDIILQIFTKTKFICLGFMRSGGEDIFIFKWRNSLCDFKHIFNFVLVIVDHTNLNIRSSILLNKNYFLLLHEKVFFCEIWNL